MSDDDYVTIDGRRYPSRYPPGGSDKDLNAAWNIIDMVKDGVLTDEARALLAGMIKGAMSRCRQEGPLK